MSRTPTPDPLLGATPALRPMARPLQIQIGATPPPRQSGLMQLADAFGDINSELRDMLRDTAAREEKDAQALGEIEATKARAEGRLAELDKILKEKVDKGELSAVRLPAAQRGAALRTGHEHAEVGLQTYLLSKKEDAVRGRPEDTEAIVSEGLKQFGSAIPQDAFYERLGFDQAATEVVSQFRRRVAQEQAVEADKYQREKRANEGTELAFQLATANADTLPTAKGLLKAHLDAIRTEMPKSEVNGFFSKSVLAPAVARLVESKDFTAAAQLLEEVKSLDLTGKGGLYGKTGEGSETILQLSTMVEQRSKTARSADADRLRDEVYVAEQSGRAKAAEIIYNVRGQNNGDLPLSERQRILTEARSQLAPLSYQTFSSIVNQEYENDERYKLNPQDGAKLLSEAETLDPKVLDQLGDKANLLLASGKISADVFHRVDLTIRKNRALGGFVTDRDVESFQKAVFAAPGDVRGTTKISVGDASLEGVWDGFTEVTKTDVRVAASDAFVENFRQQIRLLAQGNPENVDAIKAQAFDKASTAARDVAKSAILGAQQTQQKKEQAAVVTTQAKAVRSAASLPAGGMVPTLEYAALRKVAVPAGDVPGDRPGPDRTEVFLKTYEPKEASSTDLALNFKNLPADSDVGMFTAPGDVQGRIIDLKALAKDATANEDRYLKATARSVYGYIKSTLGFSPDEIKERKTKHGVEFNPAEIDPTRIRVFRSVEELNKHWNAGQPDETFFSVGDAVDPSDKMTPRAFYLAQRALLRR